MELKDPIKAPVKTYRKLLFEKFNILVNPRGTHDTSNQRLVKVPAISHNGLISYLNE